MEKEMEAIGVEGVLSAATVMEELPAEVEVEAEKILTKDEEVDVKGDDDNNDNTTLAVPVVRIAKGKRTKRQRVHPSVLNSFVAPAASSNISNGDDDDVDYNYNDDEEDDDDDDEEEEEEVIMARPLSVLPPQVVPTVLFAASTKEEEDTANCLILLAQGNSSFVTNNHNLAISSAVNNNVSSTNGKFTSRKFMETGGEVEGGGKVGYYVYECRTCNRTFPSFQALGGHRASHKKPKNVMVTNSRFLATGPSYNEEDNITNFLQLGSGGGHVANSHKGNNSNYNRVHECGQCGAEFNSGQALGGHMRRHRAPQAAIATSLSLLTTSNNDGLANYKNSTVANNNKIGRTSDEERQVLGKRGRSLRMASLDLDLNQLPAPEEKQPIANLAAPEKPTMVFPGPALVGCHY